MEFLTYTIDRLLPHNARQAKALIEVAKSLGYKESNGDCFCIYCDRDYIECVDGYRGDWSIDFEKGNIFYYWGLNESTGHSELVVETFSPDEVIYSKINPGFIHLVNALHEYAK